MVDIKCSECSAIYNENQRCCYICGNRGGYLQEPKIKQFEKFSVHLEDSLIHVKTGNTFQIKEIQSGGMLAIFTDGALTAIKGKKVYISNSDVNEYRVKK